MGFILMNRERGSFIRDICMEIIPLNRNKGIYAGDITMAICIPNNPPIYTPAPYKGDYAPPAICAHHACIGERSGEGQDTP
jgi:hypothetical protein